MDQQFLGVSHGYGQFAELVAGRWDRLEGLALAQPSGVGGGLSDPAGDAGTEEKDASDAAQHSYDQTGNVNRLSCRLDPVDMGLLAGHDGRLLGADGGHLSPQKVHRRLLRFQLTVQTGPARTYGHAVICTGQVREHRGEG